MQGIPDNPPATSRDGRPRTVGWNPSMLGFALVFVAFMTWVSAGYCSGPVDFPYLLQGPGFFGLISGVILLVATSRVRITPSCVELVNLFAITTITFAAIGRVDADNGLALVTTDGTEHHSVAFGGSLLAALTGNRRATHLRSRITAAQGAATAVPAPVRTAVTRRVRPALVLIPGGLAIAGVVGVLAARAS